MKIIAIGGEPGSGKTSLMKKIIEKINPIEQYDKVKLVPFLSKNNIIFILGKYEHTGYAQGTDRMSMACQPSVIEFLKTLPDPATVLFEGDRLFNQSFLEHCETNYDLEIIYLKTDEKVRNQRYKERGSEQNETWLSGRETKIRNILTNLTFIFLINTYENNTQEEQNEVVEFLLRKFWYV